jgi:hypothetical protein
MISGIPDLVLLPKGKQKAARGAPADWRAPLFFWRGKVDGTTWEGTWVASTEGLPSEAEFASSPNAFKLTCSVDLGALFSPTNSLLNEDAEHFASFTGSYKLDNGDGLADYEDKEHVIWGHGCPPDHHPLSEGVDHWAVVGATGNTEFGRFVSLGRLDHPPDHSGGAYDPFTRLTLARRYIADNDKRTKMSARDVAGRICIRSLSKTTNRYGPPPDENFLQVPWPPQVESIAKPFQEAASKTVTPGGTRTSVPLGVNCNWTRPSPLTVVSVFVLSSFGTVLTLA